MNERERDDYAAQKEQELREHDARVAMTEAHAREMDAAEQLKELTGLRGLRGRLEDHLKRFKDASRDNWEQIKADFEDSRTEFASRLDAIKGKLDQIDQVREEQ